jgi:hypothetical protein
VLFRSTLTFVITGLDKIILSQTSIEAMLSEISEKII